MRWVAVLLLAVATPAQAELIPVPSGQEVTFIDLITDAEGAAASTWRFRFLAPGIARDGGSVTAELALADMDAICNDFIAPLLIDRNVTLDQVIVSLSDRPVTFGETVPDATQFFEAYTVEGDRCIWSDF